MNSIYRVLTLTFLVCLSGCIRDHAVAVTNNTEDILYDVTYSDCYWSVLQPGETSEVCIPSFREDHIRFFLIDITEEEEEANNASPAMNSDNMTTMNTGANNTATGNMANNTQNNANNTMPGMTGGMTGGMMPGMTGSMMPGMGGGMGRPPRPMAPPRYRTTESFTLGEDEATSFGVDADAYEADPDYNPRPAPI